jgi:hypothetical protein
MPVRGCKTSTHKVPMDVQQLSSTQQSQAHYRRMHQIGGGRECVITDVDHRGAVAQVGGRERMVGGVGRPHHTRVRVLHEQLEQQSLHRAVHDGLLAKQSLGHMVPLSLSLSLSLAVFVCACAGVTWGPADSATLLDARASRAAGFSTPSCSNACQEMVRQKRKRS